MGSLNRLTDVIHPLNSRLKYHTKKPFPWILGSQGNEAVSWLYFSDGDNSKAKYPVVLAK